LQVKEQREREHSIFTVEGQLFFASVDSFLDSFDYNVKNKEIIIDFSNSHVWDESAVGAIDKTVLKYRENQNRVTIRGLNSASEKIVHQLAMYRKTESKLPAH